MSTEVKVWDPLVRVFHWSLVAAFTVAYVTEEEWLDLHVYAGYAVLGLVAFRALWGLVGTRHARFADFVYAPATALGYVRDVLTLRARRYIGHNPAGGLMIVVMLVSLLVTCLTGLAAYGADGGPLAGFMAGLGAWGEEGAEELHEFFANFTLALVFIHVAGVLVESLLHDENLVRAMFTGRKRAE